MNIEHMGAHWAIKVNNSILRETWKRHFNWLWVSVVVYKHVIQLQYLGQVIYHGHTKVSPLYNVLQECIVVVYT